MEHLISKRSKLEFEPVFTLKPIVVKRFSKKRSKQTYAQKFTLNCLTWMNVRLENIITKVTIYFIS